MGASIAGGAKNIIFGSSIQPTVNIQEPEQPTSNFRSDYAAPEVTPVEGVLQYKNVQYPLLYIETESKLPILATSKDSDNNTKSFSVILDFINKNPKDLAAKETLQYMWSNQESSLFDNSFDSFKSIYDRLVPASQ